MTGWILNDSLLFHLWHARHPVRSPNPLCGDTFPLFHCVVGWSRTSGRVIGSTEEAVVVGLLSIYPPEPLSFDSTGLVHWSSHVVNRLPYTMKWHFVLCLYLLSSLTPQGLRSYWPVISRRSKWETLGHMVPFWVHTLVSTTDLSEMSFSLI